MTEPRTSEATLEYSDAAPAEASHQVGFKRVDEPYLEGRRRGPSRATQTPPKSSSARSSPREPTLNTVQPGLDPASTPGRSAPIVVSGPWPVWTTVASS